MFRYRAVKAGVPPLTDADRRVLAVLERAPLSVWSRADLARQSGRPDRAVRESIERLRLHGHAVLSSSSSGGYWLARHAEEVAAFRRELRSRMQVIASVDDALAWVERQMREQGTAVQSRFA
jgi:biotin operon repressor